MTDALTISGLKKTYPDFVLEGVSLSVPRGSIVGLIRKKHHHQRRAGPDSNRVRQRLRSG